MKSETYDIPTHLNFRAIIILTRSIFILSACVFIGGGCVNAKQPSGDPLSGRLQQTILDPTSSEAAIVEAWRAIRYAPADEDPSKWIRAVNDEKMDTLRREMALCLFVSRFMGRQEDLARFVRRYRIERWFTPNTFKDETTADVHPLEDFWSVQANPWEFGIFYLDPVVLEKPDGFGVALCITPYRPHTDVWTMLRKNGGFLRIRVAAVYVPRLRFNGRDPSQWEIE